jgi:hypothetical protein
MKISLETELETLSIDVCGVNRTKEFCKILSIGTRTISTKMILIIDRSFSL